MNLKRHMILGGVLAALALSHAVAAPMATGDHEDRLKAAFVFNFLKFVEWPGDGGEARTGPLRLAVIGKGAIPAAIKDAIDGKTVQGRPVKVALFPDAAAWNNATEGSQALFVTSATGPDWDAIRTAASNRPILTIANSTGFCNGGGMLNMFEEGNRIRFEANLSAVSQAGLKLRSELLKLAVIVKTGAPPP